MNISYILTGSMVSRGICAILFLRRHFNSNSSPSGSLFGSIFSGVSVFSILSVVDEKILIFHEKILFVPTSRSSTTMS